MTFDEMAGQSGPDMFSPGSSDSDDGPRHRSESMSEGEYLREQYLNGYYGDHEPGAPDDDDDQSYGVY